MNQPSKWQKEVIRAAVVLAAVAWISSASLAQTVNGPPPVITAPGSVTSDSPVEASLTNPHEVRRITGAQIGEFFYKSSLGARLASASLGPVGQAICASTSYQEVERMQELIKECSSGNLLNEWLAMQGIGSSETTSTKAA